MKTAILVNGVPASGKSTVARRISARLGCPLFALDSVKEPLFEHFGTGDREHNRKLGRASYAIIFAALADFADPTTVVIDAWFGFQPLEILDRHLQTAGIGRAAEVWCHAPDEVVAARYGARLGARSPGHPGADYIPELVALNRRAAPTGRCPVFDVDTTADLHENALMSWLEKAAGLGPAGGSASPPAPADLASFGRSAQQ